MHYKPAQSVTITEALSKMEQYCAYQERCHKDVEDKLKTMKLIPEAREKIILHLLEHNFLNEERFAQSFARGKFRIKKWGKQRIVRELKLRQVSEYNIKTALKEISESDYLETFHHIADKKMAAMTEIDMQKKKKKLMAYLQYRGWESQLIFEKINEFTSKNKS